MTVEPVIGVPGGVRMTVESLDGEDFQNISLTMTIP